MPVKYNTVPEIEHIQGLQDAMRTLAESTRHFGTTFSSTISKSIQSGRSFEDTIRSISMRISQIALNKALQPFDNAVSNVFDNVFSSIGSATFARGGSGGVVPMMPFARGGVVSGATAFSFGNRIGVMGEAGPEAIMPLRRGSDGRLGIAASGKNSAVNVVFNVNAQDAPGFQKSEGQLTAMLARTVGRAQGRL